MTITQEAPTLVDASSDEPTCRHGYQPGDNAPCIEVFGGAEAAIDAHRVVCLRAHVFWHPRWEWLEYLPAAEHLGLVVCCVGCGEQVA